MAKNKDKDVKSNFEKLKFKDYSREGLDFQFKEANQKLQEIAKVLDDLNKDISSDTNKEINQPLTEAINEFNSICSEIDNFNTRERDPGQKEREINQKTKELFNKIFINQPNSKYSNFPALSIYYKLNNTGLSEIKNIVDQITSLEEQASELVSGIKDHSRSKFAHDYSNIFHNEALQHSRLQLKTKEDRKINKKGLGYAEYYMIAGIFLTIVFLVMIFFNFFIPNIEDLSIYSEEVRSIGFEEVTYTNILIPYYVRKILLLGLLVFGIRFCLKQYAIHKHLYTLNKHRANTLDSFEFFYNNLKEGKDESKEQYLIEIAKSVFNPKDSGYIKNEAKDPVSFIENFRLGKDQM